METFDGHCYLKSVSHGLLHDINLRLFWWVDGDVAVYLHPLLPLFSVTFSCPSPTCYLYTASKYR